MDLIKQLIQNKKNNFNISDEINEIVDEIIKYERLRKSPKFRHINESVALQKQLPTIWSAFNKDSHKMFIFENVASIVQEISSEPLQLYIDYCDNFKRREKQNLEIIGNSSGIKFNFRQLSDIPALDIDMDYLQLIDETDGQTRIAVIQFNDNKINVYSGYVTNTDVEELKIFKHYANTINGYDIIITSYSIQGNNDYTFGTCDNQPMSFEGDILHIGNHSIQLSQDEVFQRTLVQGNVDTLAAFLVEKYEQVKEG